jgi:hypothetical protein
MPLPLAVAPGREEIARTQPVGRAKLLCLDLNQLEILT